MAAEDDSADTGATPEHAEHPTPPPVAPTPVGGAAAGSSEWTASDGRGPLIGAGDFDEHAIPPAGETTEPYIGSTAPEKTQATATPLSAKPKRASSWPIAAGLVVGAGVGAAAALWVYPAVQQPADDAARPAIAAVSARVAALSTKVDALDAKTDTLQKAVTHRSAPPAAAPAAVVPQSVEKPFDPTSLEQKIAALSASLDALKAQSAGSQEIATQVTSLAATTADLQKRSETTASSLQAVQDQQKSLEGKVGTPAVAVVSGSLVEQIDQGQPYGLQIDALTSLGADPVKLALLKPNAQTGVLSAKALAAKFAALAEPILSTGHRAPPNAGFMDRMQSGLSSLVSIRRADDVSGTDLSSQVGRIQADLAHDDLADAVATWTALPADAKAKSDAWAALAKTSADAQTTARGLQSDAIAAMGAKKS